jgi:hypothetical protein
VYTGFWWENLNGKENMENSGADGKIILKCIFERWDRGTDGIAVAQETNRWRDLVNAVINFRFP